MFEELHKFAAAQASLQELDARLITALFEPAVIAGVFNASDLRWQDRRCQHPGYLLLEQLVPLSEFYQSRNAVLSAAIWSVWNTARYLRLRRGLFRPLLERKRAHVRFFVDLRALVAASAIHFSDGSAVISDTRETEQTEEYKKLATRAIELLQQHTQAALDQPIRE